MQHLKNQSGAQEPRLVTNTTQLPQIMRQAKRWCLGKLTPPRRPGQHVGKLPINATTNQLAKTNDPATWTTYQLALTGLDVYQANGLGFVIGGGWCCLDVDDQADALRSYMSDQADSGNLIYKLLELAQHTYAEISQSGTGLHLFFLCPDGKPKDSATRRGHYELYDRAHFIMTTGNVIAGCETVKTLSAEQVLKLAKATVGLKPAPGKPDTAQKTPEQIKPPTSKGRKRTRQDVGNGLDIDANIEKMLNSKKGPKLRKLWQGNLDDYGGDHSAADQALCDALAFWCNVDKGKMDAAFRKSGLMRPKWDEVHYANGETYGQHTIEQAVKFVGHGYSWSY